MNNVLNYIKRYSLPILLLILSAFLIKPAIQEINTFILIILTELTALMLSALAVFVFTKIDFVKEKNNIVLASIFTGVHLCTGLTVIGVYIAQF